LRALFLLALLATTLATCNSPTTCSQCRNGVDCIGRGPTTDLRATCFSSGSGLRCQATRLEVGYCSGPNRDVTSATKWISSNPLIADFDASTPGILTVFAPGEIRIFGTYESASSTAMTIFVAPGSAPQRDTDIGIDVRRAGTVLEGIPDAQIDITPEGAASQRCVTDARGACRFFSRMTVGGSIDVSVNKSGYAPALQRQFAISSAFAFVVQLTPMP
jgi:hypothetical protein